MSTATGSCSPSVNLTQTSTVGVGSSVQIPIQLNLRGNFRVSGTALDQLDTIHAKTYALAASTPQTIDLMALADVLGNAISFARIDLIAIRVQDQVDGQVLLVGGAGTGEFDGFLTSGGKLTVFPSTATNDGYFILQAPNATGMPVGSGSHLLKLDPGANAMSVDLIIGGRSA